MYYFLLVLLCFVIALKTDTISIAGDDVDVSRAFWEKLYLEVVGDGSLWQVNDMVVFGFLPLFCCTSLFLVGKVKVSGASCSLYEVLYALPM